MVLERSLVLVSVMLVGGGAAAQAPQSQPSQPQSQPTQAEELRKVADPDAAGGQIEAVEDPGKGKGRLDVAQDGTLRRPERALVGVELSGGVAIPFKNFLDYGSGQDTYFMENGVGGAIAVSLTLDNIELRWSYAALAAGRVKGRIPDGAVTALQLLDQHTGGGGEITQNIDVEADGALAMHNVTLGYRLMFEPHKIVRIAVPMGVGIVIAQPPDFGVLSYSLYGFGGFIGLRGEVLLADLIAIGLDTRFSIYVTEPDPNLGAAGYAATKNVFDAVVSWLPMLSVALHARVYY